MSPVPIRSRQQLDLLIVQGCTFLILDETIHHLDLSSWARFEEALTSLKRIILAVLHKRCIIDRFASELWNVKDGKIEKW